MIATLGSIIFTVVNSPDSVSVQSGEKYALVNLATGKPRLQRIGSELTEISYSAKLHRAITDPAGELEKLYNARTAGTVLPFTSGDGTFHGNYVVTNVTENWSQLGTNGEIIEAGITVNLMEYYDPNEIGTLEADSRNKAFANDTQKVVAVNTLPTAAPPANIVSQSSRAAGGHNQAALDAAKKAASNPAETASALIRAKQMVDKAQEDVAAVVTTLQENAALAAKAPEMLQAAQTAAGYIPTVLAAILAGDPGVVTANVQALGVLLSDMVSKGIQIELDIAKRK